MQFVEPNTYIAEEGKVFQRVFDGFKTLEEPLGYFYQLTLGDIILDSDGFPLEENEIIPDKIEYYEEIDIPTFNITEEE